MCLRINYYTVPELPKLAWLASFDQEAFSELSVFHGSSVECRDNWMIEGVWDGPFSSGDFHKAENVFGSGIRVEDEHIYLVPSSALVDHLFFCYYHEKLLASNSLVVLLGFTGATLDDKHDYYDESTSIEKGIIQYKKEFTVIHPEIERFYQVFFENVVITKDGISFELKSGLHEITSYQQYYDLLWGTLCRIRGNYEDPNRTIPLSAFSTLSSGYDSTAVTALAKKLGVNTCFTIKRSASWVRWSSKHAIDDGAMAAQQLNLDVIHADVSSAEITDDELYFLSTNYGKSQHSAVLNQIAFSSMTGYIERNCSAAVVFTGARGDKVWDINAPDELLNNELGQSTNDTGFSEIRLRSGFINIAIPYILAQNIRSIVTISRSAEMKPWSLGNDYDRPIARRIAESSGVSRESFGTYKKGVARHYYRLPINRYMRRFFLQYVHKRHYLSPWFVFIDHMLNQAAFVFQKVVFRVFRPSFKGRQSTTFWPEVDISFLMWIWATHLLSEKMGLAFKIVKNSDTICQGKDA